MADTIEAMARAIEPKAWAALGKENDSTKHRDARVRSLDEAQAAYAIESAEREVLRKRVEELEEALYLISETDGPNKAETVRQIHERARATLTQSKE